MQPIDMPIAAPPAEGEAIEVAPGVQWLRLPLAMALDHVNCYALDEGDGWSIVDTGTDSRRGRAIWDRILAGPLAGKPVRRVIVTHHHPDHIGLAGWFQSAHGAELWTTRTAWLFARMLRLDEQAVPPAETLAFWRAAGMDPAILAARATERPFNYADVVAPMPLGFRRLVEGQGLRAGGRDWVVRIGHGHAPDHACLFEAGGDLVLGGDQLLPTISPNLGTYVTEPQADPVADWLASCGHMQGFAREGQLVLPGHGLPYTGLPRRLAQLIDNHHGALARLEDFLTEPRSAVECFAPLYRRAIKPGEYGLALVEAVSHVQHLWLKGQALRKLRADGVWLWHGVG